MCCWHATLVFARLYLHWVAAVLRCAAACAFACELLSHFCCMIFSFSVAFVRAHELAGLACRGVWFFTWEVPA